MSFPSAERVVVDLPAIEPHHRGGLGTGSANGGVFSSLFDFTLGSTALLITPSRRSATVHLAIPFERALKGDSARCQAWIDRVASSLLFTSGTIRDANGTICSRAIGVISLGQEQSLVDRVRAFTDPKG